MVFTEYLKPYPHLFLHYIEIAFTQVQLIDKIHREKSSKRDTGIKGLVMVPTRELTMQIGDVLSRIFPQQPKKTEF